MLLGDIGDLKSPLRRGQARRGEDAPLPSPGLHAGEPGKSAEQALSYALRARSVEDKYDGIRAQAHCFDGEVRLFSRTRDDITESFPELPDALAGLPQDAILDGEIVAWSYGAGESGELGRRSPSACCSNAWVENISERGIAATRVPIAYLVSSMCFYAGGELLLERSLRQRAAVLDRVAGRPHHLHQGGIEPRKSRVARAGKDSLYSAE